MTKSWCVLQARKYGISLLSPETFGYRLICRIQRVYIIKAYWVPPFTSHNKQHIRPQVTRGMFFKLCWVRYTGYCAYRNVWLGGLRALKIRVIMWKNKATAQIQTIFYCLKTIPSDLSTFITKAYWVLKFIPCNTCLHTHIYITSISNDLIPESQRSHSLLVTNVIPLHSPTFHVPQTGYSI